MKKETTDSPVRNLRQAHKALLADLQKLEETAHASSAKAAKDLHAALKAADAHVTEHFRFEERDGYFEAVRKRAPHMERAVQQLAAEHRQLADALSGLLHGAQKVDDAFREKVRAWIHSVREHEARENRLVQEVFNRDDAAED